MASIYDIVYDYIDIFYTDESPTREDKKTIHSEVKKLLELGWCEEELVKGFKEGKKKRPDIYSAKVSQLFTPKKPKRINLIRPNVFYYHNDLRLTCAPPKREIDYDSGDITVINEPYFLEMKASYSIEDLIHYYRRQVGTSKSDDNNRFKGSLLYLLKSYTVEELLFMIDIMVNTCKADDLPLPSSPLDSQKYYKEAKEVINLKKTETIQAGGKAIVRKKRIRTS